MGQKGYFVIKAQTDPEIWTRFDHWYAKVHMPDAARRMKAQTSFRLHDREKLHTHVAVYVFDDMNWLETQEFQSAIQSLIVEFNAAWPQGVRRQRMFYDVQP
jgi:hypothetical protein